MQRDRRRTRTFSKCGVTFTIEPVEVANRLEVELYGVFETLAQTPKLGHKRSDLHSQQVLFFTLYSYLIVCRPQSRLEIARVLHGKRDLKKILEKS